MQPDFFLERFCESQSLLLSHVESELPPVGHANLPRAKDLALRCT